MGSDGAWGFLLLCGGLGLLAYTYLGYPLLTALLPKRVPARAGNGAPRSVSVIVATRWAGSAVAEKVRWLLSHTGETTETIVVLDGADPEAEAALARLRTSRLSVVRLPGGPGKAAALNRGVAIARGEVLVFADVRQRIAANAIPQLIAALDSPDVGAASAAYETEHADRPHLLEYYWRMERWVRSHEAAFDSCIGAAGCLYAVERACWEPLAPGLLLDDLCVPMQVVRNGKRVAYVPGARVVDVPFGSHQTELARKVRTLTGNYQLLLWMPWLLHPGRNRVWVQFVSHKLLRLLTPLFSGAAMLGAALLAVRALPVTWLMGGLLAAGAGLGMARWWGHGWWQLGKAAVMIHVALVAALANALRKRWDVWDDPPRPGFSEAATR